MIMKQITVDGTTYMVYGKDEDVNNPKPHIMNIATGEVPDGSQRRLLLRYLDLNNIPVINGATTYWCISKILTLDNSHKKDNLL